MVISSLIRKKSASALPEATAAFSKAAAISSIHDSVSKLIDDSKSNTENEENNNSTASSSSSSSSLVIREIGGCRSVYLLKPDLTGEEWTGLAYRLRVLGKNDSINSVLLSCPDKDEFIHEDGTCLPLSAHQISLENMIRSNMNSQRDEYYEVTGYDKPPTEDDRRNVLGGFAETALSGRTSSSNAGSPAEEYPYILKGIKELASTVNSNTRKTPLIICPEGVITDGGYSFLLGQYVIATDQTSFAIENPHKGLALDPCGLSFVLNRLGHDFNNPDAKSLTTTMAKILALTGLEADSTDMLLTGLATHYISDDEIEYALPNLEETLAQFNPYARQALYQKPFLSDSEYLDSIDRYIDSGGKVDEDVRNRKYMNAAVHNLIDSVSCSIAGKDHFLARPDNKSFLDVENEWESDFDKISEYQQNRLKGDEPSPKMDELEEIDSSFTSEESSDLIEYADKFRYVFEKEDGGVYGIMERLREVAEAKNEEEEVVEVAQAFLESMERASPLALAATHKLLSLGRDGSKTSSTFEECVQRELVVQTNLLEKEDFQSWLTSTQSGSSAPVVWKHKCVSEVTNDEIEELFQESK